MKLYWLFLEPYAFLDINDNQLFIYNTLNGEYYYSEDTAEISFLKGLKIKSNLGVIRKKEKDITNTKHQKVLSFIKNSFSGEILEVKENMPKPIQLINEIKMNRPDTFSRKNAFGKNILEELKELSLYVNSTCNNHCNNCKLYHKQFLFCNKNEKTNSELDLDLIKFILTQAKFSSLSVVNILGGDIYAYKDIDNLITYLTNQQNIIKKYFCNIKNINIEKSLQIIKDKLSYLTILIPEDIDLTEVSSEIDNLFSLENVHLQFVIQSYPRYNEVNSFLKMHQVTNFSYMPFYHNNNTFFEENIFIDKEMLLNNEIINYDTIVMNQVINKFYYGRLIIDSTGAVYANINSPKLGNIKKNDLLYMMYKELSKNRNWRLLRKNVAPCKKCVFKCICPPISNYEMILEKNNLCTIFS